LKLARIERGMKQLELSRLSGINPTRLSKIENGWVEVRPEELSALQQVLGLDKFQNEQGATNEGRKTIA
jgi:transcriptional regulator with XRE-family HTH domain